MLTSEEVGVVVEDLRRLRDVLGVLGCTLSVWLEELDRSMQRVLGDSIRLTDVEHVGLPSSRTSCNDGDWPSRCLRIFVSQSMFSFNLRLGDTMGRWGASPLST